MLAERLRIIESSAFIDHPTGKEKSSGVISQGGEPGGNSIRVGPESLFHLILSAIGPASKSYAKKTSRASPIPVVATEWAGSK